MVHWVCKARLRHQEFCTIGRKHQVSGQRQLRANANGVAANAGDDGLPKRVKPRENRYLRATRHGGNVLRALPRIWRQAARHGFEIGSHGEIAADRLDHHHMTFGIGREISYELRQSEAHIDRERIASRGPVQRDRRDTVLSFEQDVSAWGGRHTI